MQYIKPYIASVPSFTIEDVRIYVASHKFPAANMSNHVPMQVMRVEFMAVRQASEIIKNFISFQKDDIVCYVEVKSSFTFVGGPPEIKLDSSPHDEEAFMVIDASTGCLLAAGFVTR